MKRYMIGGVMALVLAIPVSALAQGSAELSELKAQVEALNKKIAELESRQSKSEAKQSKSSWTDNISVKGDLRYRFESIDEDGKNSQDRQRIRARLFVNGKVNDNTNVVMEIATGGDNPRSQDVTLGGDGTARGVSLRQAYVNWRPMTALTLTAGKMSQPWTVNPVDYFHDSDYMPEGLAVRVGGGRFYGTGYWLQIAERSADKDTSVWGAQVGYLDDLFYANVGYQDFQKIRGSNPCYNSNCNGNTVDANNNLVYDYNLVQVRGGVKIAGFDIFASWDQNGNAETQDTAYSYGVVYGKVKDPGSWSVGALYQSVERDALYGGMIDATFAGGKTAHDGYSIKGTYALSRNWVGSFIWCDNNVAKTGNEHGYNRYQLDLLWKF